MCKLEDLGSAPVNSMLYWGFGNYYNVNEARRRVAKVGTAQKKLVPRVVETA